MTEIVSLVPFTKQSNTEVIALLESFLEEARDGNLVEVAIAGVMTNSRSMTAATQAQSVTALIGAMEALKFRMLKQHEAQ